VYKGGFLWHRMEVHVRDGVVFRVDEGFFTGRLNWCTTRLVLVE